MPWFPTSLERPQRKKTYSKYPYKYEGEGAIAGKRFIPHRDVFPFVATAGKYALYDKPIPVRKNITSVKNNFSSNFNPRGYGTTTTQTTFRKQRPQGQKKRKCKISSKYECCRCKSRYFRKLKY